MERPTVLLVEDEPAVRDLVADVLHDEGYDVVQARDGAEAIRTLGDRCSPASGLSLVLLDMMLPGTDGLEVLDRLAGPAACPPVVAMSANPNLLSAAVAAGAQGVLAKPFDLTELLGVVAAHCSPG